MKLRDSQVLHGGAVLLLLLVYVLSGPRTLPEADAGEFAAVAVEGGIPHPPGYPLLALLLQGFAPLAGLLGLTPALTLSSILCACAAALLLSRTLIARGSGPTAAWTATLAVFLSANVWRDATTFEPFALNLLLAACLLACCQRLAQLGHAGPGAGRTLLAIGALFGLGLCNHHSLATLAPLPLAVLLARPRRPAVSGAWIAAGFALGAAPLLLFLFLRTQSGWVWGDWDPFLPRLATHVLRREYGTLTLAAGSTGHALYGPSRMLATLPAVLSLPFFALLAFGVLRGARRWLAREAGERDAYALGVAASFVTSGLLFPLLFQFRGTALEDMIADRFFALPVLLLAFPLAAALDALATARPGLRAAYAPGCAALLLAHAALQWPEAARVHHSFFDDHMRNVFEVAERDAVIMTASDTGFAGGLYGRHVLGRSDVSVVFSALNHDWYTRRLRAELSARDQGALGATRPLYLLEEPVTSAGTQPPVYPIGPLLRVVQAGERMPAAAELFARNEALFARLRLPSREQIARADAWEASELVNYHRVWDVIGSRLQREGEQALAEKAFAYRDVFAQPQR